MLERIKFMKVNRVRRFDYTPRYYDERKERIENMKKAYAEDVDSNKTEQQARLRERMQHSWNLESSHTQQSRSANIRLILILAALLLATYFILDYVDIFTAEVIDLENP